MVEENSHRKKTNWKIIIGCLAIAGAVIYLLISSTLGSMQYFITIDELLQNPASYQNKTVRVTGAVIGDSISVNADTSEVEFIVANISSDHEAIAESGGMAAALNEAVNNPDAKRIKVVYHGLKPDLLKDQSQAILTGRLDTENVFQSDELLLKCPTKYEAAGN
ncbi:MAG: cytochrome c maturation protein CcmE [Flexilinea sp.]